MPSRPNPTPNSTAPSEPPRPLTGRRRPRRAAGYRPQAALDAGASPTFASGFHSFLATGRLSLALRLGLRYGVDREYLPRYLGILTANALFAPLRFWQTLTYARAIRRAPLHPEPLFLLGFWRSGTTLLHNLLATDPRWGFVTTYQAAMPDVFLAGRRRIRRLLASQLPETRGIDNIPVDFAMPQEEEIALMCASARSPYLSLNFPRTADAALAYLFPRERLPPREQRRWQNEYRRLLQAASLNMDGRPLLLKSPSNTARISALLELFPAARFVYIQRNPYDTLRSYIHLLRLMNHWHALQRADFHQLLRRQVQIYRRMAQTYLQQRRLIPPGRLVEIRYETLEQNQIGTIRHIYDTLALDGYETFAPRLSQYAASIAGFQKNPSHISDEVIRLVNQYVPFLLTEYGYPRQEPAGPEPVE